MGEKTNGAAVINEIEQQLTLEEFCRRLSMTDRRVEMIGAFHYVERVAGVIKYTETVFRERYAAFCDKPVQ